jgi:hypothetical protein
VPGAPSRRGGLLVVFILFALVTPLVAAPAAAAGAIAVAPGEGELDDVAVASLDASIDPETILRSRPFVIGGSPCPLFCPSDAGARLTERQARRRLERFLGLRGLDETEIEAALARYDADESAAIVPEPNLRAAILMLWDWEPYAATIRAVFDGENPSGQPFAAVDFGDLGIDGAVATLIATRDARHVIVVDDDYRREPPEALVNVVVHESLHDPWQNSQEEEIIANILDNILYGEIVLVDPEVADEGTLLVSFNNFALLALLNSTGRAGPGQLGISATPFDDVWLGDLLDEIDASSVRDAIAGDGFYAELPTGGSSGQETYWALIGRFPDADALGPSPDFDEAALTVIDRGVGEVITPAEAVELAGTLGLDLAAGITEFGTAGDLPDDAETALALRPFVATDHDLLDLAAATDPSPSLDEDEARDALSIVLRGQGLPRSDRNDLLSVFDDPTLAATIPDPSLRAAAVLLAAHEPWNVALDAILGELRDEAGPIPVGFADLPFDTPVARGSDDGDEIYPILVNEDLAGEPLPVLASYLVEGLLLHERHDFGRITRDQAVLSHLLGTLTYAEFVVEDPELVALGTAGTIGRNRDVFALLNSATWQSPETSDLANADQAVSGPLGFLGAPAGVDDILPGLYADATSFADYVTSQPRASGYSKRTRLAATPIVASFLSYAGVDVADLEGSVDGMPTFGEAGAAFDARLGAFVSPEEALRLARALDLGLAQ